MSLHSPVLKKAEDQASVKKEDGKAEDSPAAKRLCTIYEKKMSKLPEGTWGLSRILKTIWTYWKRVFANHVESRLVVFPRYIV